jgi:TIR domain
MYLASFRTPEDVILQGMVRLPGLPRVPEGIREQWWKNHTELIQGIPALRGAGAGLRVTLNPGVSLHRTLFACAPQARSMQLRRFLAPFTRLDTLVTGSATLPLSREDYDVVADDVALMRCRVVTPSFQAGGARLACGFRVAPLLDSLLAQADAYGYRLGYHVNVRFVEIDRERIRAARKNALEIRDLPGAPRSLVMMQQRLADQLLDATAVCEEYLAVDAGPAVQWLREALRWNFHQQFEALRFEAGSWEFVEGGYEEELACASFTTSDELLVDELCAAAIQDSQITRLLSWRPSDNLADRFAYPFQADAPEPGEPAVPPANLPLAYAGGEPYLFVSYKRADLDRVAPVMLYLQERGYKLWYDRGILGGDDWITILEERLTSCRALLLFLSQAAIDSKYARREVLFADSIDKRIISVRLEATRLKYGMGLLLPRYQMIDQSIDGFLEQLTRALNHLR